MASLEKKALRDRTRDELRRKQMELDEARALQLALVPAKPDLILMDMSLPVMDGLKATRQVKAAPETRSIPIIALTANALVEDREKALAAGATISTPSQSNYRDCWKRLGISWGQAIRRAEVLFSPPLSAHVPAFRCKPFIACPPVGRILEKHGVTHVKPLRHMRKLGYVVTAAVAVSALTPQAMAEETLKVSVARQGAWDTAVADLGQRAGIFKKHGLTLDLAYPRPEDTIEPAVISGSADVGLGVGIVEVLRAYATKSAPIRIIGANMTGSANYWYVAATSPIKTVKDINGKTIAYSKADASSQYDVFDFMQRYGVKARPVLIAGATPTFDQVVAGKIDVGWATPPFGVDALEQGRIRVLAKANDIPKIRDKTDSVTIVTADTLQKRKDVVERFVQAYRDTVEWMYSDPAALKAYAEFAGMPEEVARRMRDDFYTKDMLSPNSIVGLDAIAKEAAKVRQIWAPLSRKQTAELVQIPAPLRANASAKSGGWFRALSPRSP